MTGWFARRGSRDLNKDEFLSHLALAIRLENVGVLLGAGASKGAGGKVMAEIWEKFRTEQLTSAQWLVAQNFLPNDALEANARVNIEELLDKLEIAEADLLRRKDDTTLAELAGHRTHLRCAVLDAAILNEKHWEGKNPFDNIDFLGDHVRMVSRLVANRQPGQAAPWVFTTNYDLSIEWAAEILGVHLINGFTGLHNRTFHPNIFDLGLRNVVTRGEARFGTYNVYLGKLHGSLSWRTLDDGTVVELPAPTQWDAITGYLAGTVSDWPGLLIFPGAAKYVQTTGFIYGEIIRRFVEFLSRPNTCLILNGYGFGDDHINRILISALQNPTLQLIIYLPEINRFNLFPTLPVTGGVLQPPPMLENLIRLQLPQVTICGYGAEAYFNAMASHLPEPALMDDTSIRAKELEKFIRGVVNQPIAPRMPTPPPTAETAQEDAAE